MYLVSLLLLLIALAAACMTLIKRIGRLAILLLYPGIMMAQYVANLITLDSGIYVYELGTTTYNVYSAQVYIIFLIIFIYALVLFSPKRLRSRIAMQSLSQGERVSLIKKYQWFILLIFIASISFVGYVLLDMAVSGVPLLSRGTITHYNYFNAYSKLPAADTANNLLTFCAAVLGAFYVLSIERWQKILALVVTAAMLVCRVLLGFKMTGLIDVVIAFAVGAILFGADTRKLKSTSGLRTALIFIVLAFAAIILYLNYAIYSGEAANIAQALDMLVERVFGMGAHLWWAALADRSNGLSLFPRTAEETLSPFTFMSELDTSIGVYGMMIAYGNPIVVTADIAGGVRYTADFITTTMYYDGYILGIIVILGIAGVTACFIRLFDGLAANAEVASFFVAYYLFVPFTTYLCATGTLTTFFNLKSYAVLAVLAFLLLLHSWMQVNVKRKSVSGHRIQNASDDQE